MMTPAGSVLDSEVVKTFIVIAEGMNGYRTSVSVQAADVGYVIRRAVAEYWHPIRIDLYEDHTGHLRTVWMAD